MSQSNVGEVYREGLQRGVLYRDRVGRAGAVSGPMIRATNLEDIKDLVAYTPGVTGNSKDSFIDYISVRGILTNDFGIGGDPSMGLYKNNLYQGRNGVALERPVRERKAAGQSDGRVRGPGAVRLHLRAHRHRPRL